MIFPRFFHVFLHRDPMQLGEELLWQVFVRYFCQYSGDNKYCYNLLQMTSDDMNLGKFFRDSGSADVVTWHCSTAMGERSTQSAQARQQHHNLLLNRSVSARQPDNNTTTLTEVFQLDSLLLNRSVSAKQPDNNIETFYMLLQT